LRLEEARTLFTLKNITLLPPRMVGLL